MKKKILVMLALMLVVVMSLSSCGVVDWFKGLFAKNIELTDAPLNAEKIIDFADGANPDVLFESDGWSNGDVFNVVWKKHNVHYENGIMRLGITAEQATAWVNDQEVTYNYTAGEARTQNYYHYGDYEVSMKPSANGGTASTFFVCTGPYDTKNGIPNAHDEIDIEFLGDDTTHVQFNFFVNGVGGNEYMYDLGFDASKEFHRYGFRWEPNAITWFVDGVPVYKVTTDDVKEGKNLKEVDKLPSTAGRILTNYWCGNEDAEGWMGVYEGETHDNGTTYQWIATSAEGAPLNPPVVEPPVGGDTDEIDWTAIEPIAPTFATTPEYTVTVDGNAANVTYTDVSGSAYKPIEMDVTEAVADKNYISMKVTNNGTEMVQVRVNMYDPTLTGNNTATNISATMNGEPVYTDMAWGGSFFEIPAGETAELVLKFGVGGIKLQLMIDSSRNDGVLRSGDVTVEDIKFAAVGEVEVPHSCNDEDGDGICDECGEGMIVPPSPPADPVSGNLTTTIGGAVVELGGNVTDGYGVHGNEEDGTIRVEYTNISTNTYENVWVGIADVAAGKNEISLKIKNNGEATAYITVKIEAAGAVALMEGKMEIPAGEEQVYTGTFTGVADKLYFFIDSGWSAENTTHAGEVLISEIAFSGEVEGGEDPVDPNPPVQEELVFNFWTSDGSLYTTNGNNIIYNGAGNTYACVGTDIAALAAGNNTFTVTITNNGTGASRVRIDIQGTTQVGNHTVLNTSAVGGDVWTDMDWGGSTVTVAPGESVTLVITYDENTDRGAVTNLIVMTDSGRGDGETYSSDITLSGMGFSKVGGEEPNPDPTPDPEPTIEYTDLYVEYKTENAYTLTAPDTYANQVRVTYTDIAQNSWANINIWVEDKSADCSIFSMKLTNHGAATVSVWVQMKDADGAELINQNVDIAAGAEQVVSFEYTGTAQLIFFFIDSTHEADAETNVGDITISELKLGKVVATEEPAPEPTPDPEPVVEGEYLSFKANECYTLNATEDQYVNVIDVTYTEVSDNTYQNVNTWIQDKATDKTTLGVTIKNNGAETVTITVKLENGASEAAETKVVLLPGETQTVELAYTFAPDLLYFFIDSGWSETTAAHAGAVQISGINFK